MPDEPAFAPDYNINVLNSWPIVFAVMPEVLSRASMFLEEWIPACAGMTPWNLFSGR